VAECCQLDPALHTRILEPSPLQLYVPGAQSPGVALIGLLEVAGNATEDEAKKANAATRED
jgi:hypothetical protein